MNAIKKLNTILSVILLCIGCVTVYGQQNQTNEQKKNQSKDAQKNQADVFDASTATLEETQAWLKKTLVKFGRYTFSDSNASFKGRVESVKFKGCELSYTRSLWTVKTAPSLNVFTSVSRESMNTNNTNNPFNDYSEVVSNSKINLAQMDADKISIIDKGKVFWVQVFSQTDSDKSAIEGETDSNRPPFEVRDKVPPIPKLNYKANAQPLIVTDKQVANQVKDALVRTITLCRQKQVL